jgi:LacI family transcriptional regulator
VGKLRTDGYLQAFRQNNLIVKEELILKIEDIENCAVEIEKFVAEHDMDGIFAVNELFAVTAIKAASKLGKKVPDDLSVIGFTDGIISKFSTPSITTVSQDGVEMGKRAAKLLIDRLENDEDDEFFTVEIVETYLVERESTR